MMISSCECRHSRSERLASAGLCQLLLQVVLQLPAALAFPTGQWLSGWNHSAESRLPLGWQYGEMLIAIPLPGEI